MQIKDQFIELPDGLIVHAPAKINLCLLVAGRRSDGYHQLKTVMAKVALYDELTIRPVSARGIWLTCTGPYWAPAGQENLVFKAAKTLLEAVGSDRGFQISLRKQIPAGSGLGSASSDAAATLLGLARLLCLNDGVDLRQLAAGLGSDVAFFLDGPLALCTGRGEVVQPIHNTSRFLILLILPDVHVSTARVYANYVHDPDLYARLDAELAPSVAAGKVEQMAGPGTNMLTGACLRLHPELAVLKSRIEQLVGQVSISGSGSAMFRLYDHRSLDKARLDAQMVTKEVGCTSLVVPSNPW